MMQQNLARGNRESIFFLLKICFTLLALLFLFSKIDAEEVWKSMTHANRGLLLLSIGLTFLAFYLDAIKWHRVISKHDSNFSKTLALTTTLLATAGSTLTPFHLGKYAAYFYSIRKLPKLNLILLGFLNGQLVAIFTLIFGAISLAVYFQLQHQEIYAGIFFMIAFACIVIISLLPSMIHRVSSRTFSFKENRIGKIGTKLISLLKLVHVYSFRDWLIMLGSGFAMYCIYLIQFSVVTQACFSADSTSVSIPVFILILVASATSLVKAAIPFFIADLGIREASIAFFLIALGYDASAGVAASLIIFMLNRAIPSAIGLSLIPQLRSDLKSE